MTFARRLLLVGSDHRFSQTVQTHLHKTFLLTTPVVRAEDVPELVTRDTDGVLLFLASDAADAGPDRGGGPRPAAPATPAEAGRAGVRGVRRRPGSSTRRRPTSTRRFAWPDQLRDLNAWVRRGRHPGAGVRRSQRRDGPQQRLRRQLLNLTPSLAPLVEQLDIAAAHDVTVLIEGETGTGKTLPGAS